MSGFDNIRFAWTFRTYQQAVLDKAAAHLRDGHIHIVAAPGSGKTILGLELVRRLGKPALVLAPSVTIRQQWGERFAEAFLPKGSRAEDYVSEDLRAPKLLTCVTYQALHAAMQKTVLKPETGDDDAPAETAEDFTDFDLMAQIRSCGIETVCLDEAHHLRREWQKALESFLQQLGGKARIIALTATPPYDSTPAEWDSYIRVCGEVDEEIFVPQLVAQKTLCPHQDYVYLNMPTDEETQVLLSHRARAQQAVGEILESGLLREAWDAAQRIDDFAQQYPHGAPALSLAGAGKGGSIPLMQTAVSFVLTEKDVFPQDVVDKLGALLSKHGLLEKGKVCLQSTDKLDKMLLSSAGKIESIQSILSSEAASLGEDLRALVLTDYIRKEMLPVVGTSEPLSVMGAVPVFEAVRRSLGKRVPTALLSGTLVILPEQAVPAAEKAAAEKGVACTSAPLPNVPYRTVQFAGSNKNKVSVLTELFQNGDVRVLIGTASLLGEGWDAPCINALVLASAVGSFMLTNQMRGRAIRIDKSKPDKASNIWHLVTVEPQQTADDDIGADFAMMQRRFDGFLAPDCETPWIESGLDRLGLPGAPYTENGMQAVNTAMLERSRDRDAMVRLWRDALGDDPAPQVLDVCEVPQSAFSDAPARRYRTSWIVCAVLCVLLALLPTVFTKVLAVIPLIAMLVFLSKWRSFRKPEVYFQKAAQLLLGALRQQREVQASGADVYVRSVPQRQSVYVALKGASRRDKMTFSQAMGTLYSAIDDPRYVLVPEKGGAKEARAVPAVCGGKKEDAERLAKAMEPLYGKAQCVYTRGQKERGMLLQCRKEARLNAAGCRARYKKIVVSGASRG